MAVSSSRQINLKNKVALVTGAAQGIGLEATKALLRSGARVSKYTGLYIIYRHKVFAVTSVIGEHGGH